MKFGRKQKLAMVIFGSLFVTSLVLVGAGQVTGAEWLDFAKWFGPGSLAGILGPAAIDARRKHVDEG